MLKTSPVYKNRGRITYLRTYRVNKEGSTRRDKRPHIKQCCMFAGGKAKN
jgi:hypothetical protein